MATATFKFNPSNKVVLGDATQDLVTYYGTISFSAAGDTYATGGILPTTGFGLASLGPYANRTPLFVDVQSSNGSSMMYLWNQTTGKLQVFTGNSSGSATTSAPELSNNTALNATTPAISTDVINFRICFPMSIN
jgi:hypothetical protein